MPLEKTGSGTSASGMTVPCAGLPRVILVAPPAAGAFVSVAVVTVSGLFLRFLPRVPVPGPS